jgi:hypothetical protein
MADETAEEFQEKNFDKVGLAPGAAPPALWQAESGQTESFSLY